MARARIQVDFDENFFDEVLNCAPVRAMVDAAANKALAEAKATAPVDTGAYRDSLHIEHRQSGHRQVAEVVADCPHAMGVEAVTGNLARAARKARA